MTLLADRAEAMVAAAMAPTLAEAAMAYARAGIAVFPTKPGSKDPLHGSHAYKDATTDPEKVAAWWAKTPEANIACQPGWSGFLVVDVDGPERIDKDGSVLLVADGKATWERLREQYADTSATLRTLSPGKGKGSHWWFAYPDGRSIGCPKVAGGPGLQVYGARGYVMLPPSVHPNGQRYTFADGVWDAPLAPAWLLDKVPDSGGPSANQADDSQLVKFLEDHSGAPETWSGWRLILDDEAAELADADLRHPTLLSLIGRFVAWSQQMPGAFDLNEALSLVRDVFVDAVSGEGGRDGDREFLRAVRWTVGQELAEINAEIAAAGGGAPSTNGHAPHSVNGVSPAPHTANGKVQSPTQGDCPPESGPEWPELVSLKPPAAHAPLDVIPPRMRAVIDAVAAHTQTPPEHGLLLALSAVSAATAGNAAVNMGWVEPGALWTMSVADPSDRKSAVNKLVAGDPLTEACAAVTLELTSDIRDAEAELKAAAARLAGVEKAMGRDEPTATPGDWAAAKAEVDEIDVPIPPEFLLTDATPESIESVMAEQRGVAAAFIAEGDLIGSLAGRYSDNKARVGSLNSAWSAEAIYIRRVKGGRSVPHPHLAMGLIIQPTVLSRMGQTPLFVDTGFTARWLYALPDTFVGSRDNISPVLDAEVMADWRATVAALLSRFWNLPAAKVLDLDSAGHGLVRQLRSRVEDLLAQDTLSPSERYWLGKSVGQIGRIALAFTLSEDPGASAVPAAALERAIGLFEYFWREARTAFGRSVEVEGADLEHAKAVVSWVKRQAAADKFEATEDGLVFSSRDLAWRGPGRYRHVSDDDRAAVLAMLEDNGYLRAIGTRKLTRAGGNPGTPRWLVSPRITSEDFATEPRRSATEPQNPATEPARFATELTPRGINKIQNCDNESQVLSQLSQHCRTTVADTSKAVTSENEVLSQLSQGSSVGIPKNKDLTTLSNNDLQTGNSESLEHNYPLSENRGSETSTENAATFATEPPSNGRSGGFDDGPPPGFDSWEAWDRKINPNLFRAPVNPGAMKGIARPKADGSCPSCGAGADRMIHAAGLTGCDACGEMYSGLVISSE